MIQANNRPNRIFKALISSLFLLLSLLIGCAQKNNTVGWLTGGEYRIKVITNPPGAKVYADEAYIGISPCKIPAYTQKMLSLTKAIYSPKTIRVEKDGYISKTIPINTRWDLESFHILRLTLIPKVEQEVQEAQSSAPAFSSPVLTTSRGYALIIGISQYQHTGKGRLTNLVYADDDAKAFAKKLKDLGWNHNNIKLLTNEQATKRNIEIALESWLTKAGPDDQIVLFWSGHGYPDAEDPEKVYFACYDTDINIPATGYRMDKVRLAIEEHKARNVIVLADTCHAGKLITRGDKGISIMPQIEKMRSEENIPKGWIFMVGADTDRLAIENSSWSNGAFTHCLIKGLSGEADGFESTGPQDGVVTMGELRAYLNSAMPDETQKVLGVAKRPVITTSTGDPDIWDLTLQIR